jgi:hypothetical protein
VDREWRAGVGGWTEWARRVRVKVGREDVCVGIESLTLARVDGGIGAGGCERDCRGCWCWDGYHE